MPHQGAMCLLDSVEAWSSDGIVCRALSHLAPDNPLRHSGVLGGVSGVEYGLQAAALHGALCAGRPSPPGYLAGLRDVKIDIIRLDDPALGTLRVAAAVELSVPTGVIYHFDIASQSGRSLIRGRTIIVMPADEA